MTLISLKSVSKVFELVENRPRSLQELVLGWLHGEKRRVHKTLHALEDISFEIGRGETVGLIGTNGSGKSTCLKLLTRILWPTSGTVIVDGRVAALLELGAGFHPELTGRENILLNGSVLGISRREMMARFDEIISFAELERFIDVPIKVYSSGMYVRLAFATAISVDADILLVDEVLAVGDQSFQEKCLDRIQELKETGVTIVLVSHDLDSIAKLCDRVIWLDDGHQVMDGPADNVIASYLRHVHGESLEDSELVEEQDAGQSDSACDVPEDPGDAKAPPLDDAQEDVCEVVEETDTHASVEPVDPVVSGPVSERWGSQRMVITQVEIRDCAGAETDTLVTDQPAEIVIRYDAPSPVRDVAFGVAFHLADGTHVSGCNTKLSGYQIGEVSGQGAIRYRIERLSLLPGDYFLSVAAHNTQETEAFDYHSFGYGFSVELGDACPHQGIAHIPAAWAVDISTDEVSRPS